MRHSVVSQLRRALGEKHARPGTWNRPDSRLTLDATGRGCPDEESVTSPRRHITPSGLKIDTADLRCAGGCRSRGSVVAPPDRGGCRDWLVAGASRPHRARPAARPPPRSRAPTRRAVAFQVTTHRGSTCIGMSPGGSGRICVGATGSFEIYVRGLAGTPATRADGTAARTCSAWSADGRLCRVSLVPAWWHLGMPRAVGRRGRSSRSARTGLSRTSGLAFHPTSTPMLHRPDSGHRGGSRLRDRRTRRPQPATATLSGDPMAA